MKINDIKIPTPFQFSMDDIGWIEGRVPYWDGFQPTRTGIPRRHTLKDYQVIEELGKAINMKICGMFVIGDWDRKGILKDVPYATKLGKNWEGSPYVDVKEEEEIRDFINSCKFFEMSVHGLMHECWDENGECMSAEFVPPRDFKLDNEKIPAPEWYMRAHLDAFFEIFNDWGFTHVPRAFTCPGHCFDAWKDGSFTKILKDYGIKFWQEPYITHTIYENNVMLNKMPGWIAFWEAYDLNPDKLKLYDEDTAGIICAHWPNFLRLDPDLNFDNIPKWKAYFDRQSNVFGVIISRDVAFAHHQLLYKNNCQLSEEDGKIKIDFTKADEIAPKDFDAPLYISVKKDSMPFECEGGIMKEFETKNDFISYEIKRNGKNDVFLKTSTPIGV
ncbi:MAG: hypothetical protein II998_10295 [Clostridia bacterium]|nr:hypothetical protein [Clostridia bacterium]